MVAVRDGGGEPARGALLFERQRGESSKAFAAFECYLGLGVKRTQAAVVKQQGACRHRVEVWSRKYRWRERIAARDAYLAEVERKAIERVATEKAVAWGKLHEPVRREAWLEAERAIAMVREARERWEKSGRTPGFEGMARMVELAFKLKQFAAGMPTEVKETHTHVTGQVSLEWEAAIRKAYGSVETGKAETLKEGVGRLEIGDREPGDEERESVERGSVVEAEVIGGQSSVSSNQLSGSGKQLSGKNEQVSGKEEVE